MVAGDLTDSTREDADFLRLSAIDYDEIVFRHILDRSIFVADDDAKLDEAGGYADFRILRGILRVLRCQ